MMLPSRWLPHLRHHVELAAQKALLFLDAPIVETHTTLHQKIQLRQKLPHHPLTERRVEQLQTGDRSLAWFELQRALNQLAQQPTALHHAITLLMVLGQNLQPRATRRFKHSHVGVPFQRTPPLNLQQRSAITVETGTQLTQPVERALGNLRTVKVAGLDSCRR
ncbi:hypothetical protein FQZ97_764290 [compost metagenome]